MSSEPDINSNGNYGAAGRSTPTVRQDGGEWIDPPSTARGRGGNSHSESAALARSRPGEWLKLPGTFSSSVSTCMRKGMYVSFREPGEWEVTSRAAGGGRSFIWVRYVGKTRD
jgi:hypothetical protein